MQSMATYRAARVNAFGHSPANFLNLNNDSSWLYAWRYGKGEKKTECRPLKTFRMWGKMHIPIPKSHFYHRPSAHARNYGKMHGSHPNFEKLTIDFMLRRHYKCAFYTVICGIFITSLLSDLSLRVVTYDRTVVFFSFDVPNLANSVSWWLPWLSFSCPCPTCLNGCGLSSLSWSWFACWMPWRAILVCVSHRFLYICLPHCAPPPRRSERKTWHLWCQAAFLFGVYTG